jgi:tetratricopeptide (TPR) repeat protein
MIEIIEIVPKKDTTINSAMPYENYGDYYALFLGKYMNHSIYRSLLQFDLPMLSGQGIVEKVELILYIIRNNDLSYRKEFEIYRITEKFDENAINYANQPSADKIVYKTFTIQDEVNTYIKVDITKLFSEWYCEKHPNHGLLIKAVAENETPLIAFCSKDTSEESHTPKLQIYFKKSIEKDAVNNTKNIEDDKWNSERYYIVGNKYFEKEAYLEAYDYYKKSLETFTPNTHYSSKLLFRMIMVLDKLKKYDEGLEMIEQGLKYYPDFTDLAFLRASLFHKQNKITLAIKEFKKCMDMGESPLHVNFILGVDSYRTFHALAQIYLELEDFDEAYNYCVKALHVNPKYTDPLHTIAKILIDKERDINDIKLKLEGFLGTDLDGKDYMILADVFIAQRKYTAAYEYLLMAEEFIKNLQKISYDKGMCQLNLKKYDKAYEYFAKIKEGKLREKVVFKMVLCEIINYNMNNATNLLSMVRDPENNDRRRVYYAFKNVVEGKNNDPISDNKNESEQFADIIFDLLNTLIQAASPEIFEKSLQLLNLIEYDEVLLRLAKLYYHHGFYNMAYEEFVRSIKFFDKIDLEGINMMKKAFLKIK